MRLVRFGKPGKEKPGLIDGEGKIRDLSDVIPDLAGAALSHKSLNKIRKIKPESLPKARGEPRLGPCVGDSRNFIAVGLNYADHAAETGAAIPKEPHPFQQDDFLHRWSL